MTTMTVVNNAGGEGSFAVSNETRLRRFLVLGCEGGTYYQGEKELTLENAAAVAGLIESGQGGKVVQLAQECSVQGKAAKQKPALFVLAMAARLGDVETRRAAYAALGSMCRIPTQLFTFIGFVKALGEGTGWGRLQRRAIGEWYNGRDASNLAYAMTKYQSREGWSHRDVLRLAHVKPASPAHDLVFRSATRGLGEVAPPEEDEAAAGAHALLLAIEEAKTCTEPRLIELIAQHRLAREHLPTSALGSIAIWQALLPQMGLTALLRNLAKMTSIGMLKPLADETATVVARLTDAEQLRSARVHPFNVLVALRTYQSGRGARGNLSWTPVPEIVAALDQAFELAFDAVVPTGKRHVIAMDVSGSMGWGDMNGTPGITPRVGAAAMALVAMRTEPRTVPLAFTDGIVPLAIDARMSLDEVVGATSRLPFGGTDCAQPMLYALKHGIEADVFVVYTDCETWAGSVTPVEALKRYRTATGIDAKLVVVGMTSNGFSLADPNDAGMLDVVGFDSSAPSVMADFIRGEL